MKWLGFLLLAVVAVVGLLRVVGQGPAVPALGLGTPAATEAPAPGYAASAARLVQTDDAGQPQFTLEAAQLRQGEGSQDVHATELTVHYLPAGEAPGANWTLRAATGLLPAGSTRAQLAGGVDLRGRPAGGAEELRLATASLELDLAAQTVATREPVTLWSGPRRLQARGLAANLKQGKVRLESNVHGRFLP